MKTCQYHSCSYPVFSHGYCQRHQWCRKDEDYDRRTAYQKYHDNLKKNGCVNKQGGLIVSKTKELIEDNMRKASLREWFAYHVANSKKICENCGASLEHYSEKDWHDSQHHIIEKSALNGCPSVAAEIQNHGVLGRWCCHPQWHASYKNAQKMPFFKIAVIRFMSFEFSIPQHERHKIPYCFIERLTEVENKILNEIIE